jgi:hypothetical protein
MSHLSKPESLRTIEDNRWALFQADARRRRIIAITVTAVAIALAYFYQMIWIFVLGEAGLWLVLRTWRLAKR